MEKKPLLKRLYRMLGPGFLTGAADNDPTSVATYSQTGASFGFGQLWSAPFALPFMIAIQEMCGRIGIVTGQGLAGVIRRNYSKKILYTAVFLLLGTNIITIGADLGAMASSLQLLFPLPFFLLLFGISIGPMLLELFIPYPTYARFLKILTLSLIAYFITALLVTNDWGAVVKSIFNPHLEYSEAYILNLVAILGTTISPYLFFWQSDQEVEEQIVQKRIQEIGGKRPVVTERHIRDLRLSTTVGMLFSQIITVCIIVTAAVALGGHGITDVGTAAQAAKALGPLAGNFASILFTLGIVGTGLLAVPILAGSGAYAISETFGWKASLGKTFHQAPAFHMVIIISTIIGLFINAFPIDPIKMLYYAAVINGLVAPVLMALILVIGNNKKIMGNRTNSFLSNILGLVITLVMGGIALLLLWELYS
jgi:NRAMP (natural resistance-associated macrophage protein)-like metal ion transporter